MTDERINTRTAHKQLGIEYTLTPTGHINIRSELGSGEAHTIHVDDSGSVEKCTCKGFQHTNGCYHEDYVNQNGRLRAAARACTERQTVVTDGGTDEDDDTNPIDDVLPDEWLIDAPNPTERDDEPEPGADVVGSESPDMGRGPSGVDEL